MNDLVLNDLVAKQLEQYIYRPGQAILLVGAAGIGKGAIAQRLVVRLLAIRPEQITRHPYISHMTPQQGTISIASIRELQHFLQLRTIGQQPYRRAVIIEQGTALTTEAQNAFLKLLEEPPADTLLLLTADTPRGLLPTIRSRVQSITIQPPTEAQLKNFFLQKGKSPTQIERAYFLTGGLPGLMHALLNHEETHPLLESISQAKALLQQPAFERLAQVDALAKQKDKATGMLNALVHIARTGLSQAGKKQEVARIKRWHQVLKEVHQAQSYLQNNANAKLVLTHLMLNI